MKKNTFIILFFLLVLNACNNIECINVKFDPSIKELEDYKANFFDENYTGTLIDYFNETDSVVKHKVFYKNGKITQYESFYEDGSPKVIKPIKCKSIHGKMGYYYPNYKLAYDLEYNLGKKEGIGHSYFESGTVQKIVNYKNDLKDGRQLELSEKEDTIVVEVYEKGSLISKLEPFKEAERLLTDTSDPSNIYSALKLMARYQKYNKPSKELQEELDNAMTVEEYKAQEALKEKNQ